MPRSRYLYAFVAALVSAAIGACSSAPRPRATDSNTDGTKALAARPVAAGTSSADYKTLVAPFFDAYCTDCHSGNKPKGGLNLAELPSDFTDLGTKADWAEVVDMLNSHEMPPEDEQQPSPAEVAKVVDWISAQLRAAEMQRRESATVLRRLNRAEFHNTIADLTGVDFDVSGLPMDPSAGGFDNVGSALTMSPLHMELYLDAARDVLDQALVDGPRPKRQRYHFEAEQPAVRPYLQTKEGLRVVLSPGKGELEDGFRVLRVAAWDKTITARDFRLPHAGTYIVRVRAAGHSPSHKRVIETAEPLLKARLDAQIKKRPESAKWERKTYERDLAHFRSDRMFDYGPARLRVTRALDGQPEVIDEYDVDAPREKPAVYETRTRFNTGKSAIELDYAYVIPNQLENFRVQYQDSFARPQVWVDWYEIEGPIYESWPPASHRMIVGDVGDNPTRAEVEQILSRFMTRAFRRPVSESEVHEKLALYDQVRKGRSFLAAIKVPLVAVLVSPHFLYMVESKRTAEQTELSEYELATRLSYFLWSSMPDDTLFELAADGSLSQPNVLKMQVERMLKDERSQRFVRNFAGQWLGLREVGANPPVPQLYPRYDRHLETSIVGEGEAFFDHILRDNVSVMSFVRSDFVTVNERLARFYDIPGVDGDRFRPVKVPKGVPRGGIVTQAAMLSITSNGTRTSPVKRGAWVMKNLLGQDPGLPVANAGEIAPKVPGIDKATVRQRLEIHRSQPMCARCHDKMDPLGLALENFNAAGEWREREGFGYHGRIEDDDPKIDASATMPDGTEFVGVSGLQDALLKRRELFLSCLSGKMFAYALGRELTQGDQEQVQAAVAALTPGHDSLRDLLHIVVQSTSFRSK